MPAPLLGLRIVTTAVYVPGPLAAATLRDSGASIVKVEPPNGDPLSAAAPAWYHELSAGMDVRRLDLKSKDGNAQLHDLLASADALITASRPSSLGRLGLSWPEVHDRHPRLCQTAIVGYAAPRQEEAGHDLTYQADAGLLTPPAMPRTLVADLAGAQRVVSATLESLLARERSGEAGYLEIALSDAAKVFAEPLRHGVTGEAGWLGGGLPAYAIYPAREGWVAVAALEPQFRAALGAELEVDVDDREALARVLLQKTARDWHWWAAARAIPMVQA